MPLSPTGDAWMRLSVMRQIINNRTVRAVITMTMLRKPRKRPFECLQRADDVHGYHPATSSQILLPICQQDEISSNWKVKLLFADDLIWRSVRLRMERDCQEELAGSFLALSGQSGRMRDSHTSMRQSGPLKSVCKIPCR
jgi:hypothetical protein